MLPRSFQSNSNYRQVITVMGRGVLLSLIVLAVIFAVGLLIVRSRGEQLLSVQTGSMVPTLRPGDAVIVKPSAAHDLTVGDIVSYQSPRDSNLVVTHRLTRVDKRTGWLTTTG
ncbi:MAG: S26 family signal peptidase, partial [Candidatus Saccharimonadales bacterium]